ncbi:MAG: hypothetical protein IJA11_07980 [Oscillospiraceae bacterium]|nr:hypothetical protein [Oscillospiraceae bacterium]
METLVSTLFLFEIHRKKRAGHIKIKKREKSARRLAIIPAFGYNTSAISLLRWFRPIFAGERRRGQASQSHDTHLKRAAMRRFFSDAYSTKTERMI